MCVSVCINYILSVFLYYKVQCYLAHKLDYKYIAAYMKKSMYVSAKTRQYRKGLNQEQLARYVVFSRYLY